MIEAGDCTWGVPDPGSGDDILLADRTTLIDMVADTGASRFCQSVATNPSIAVLQSLLDAYKDTLLAGCVQARWRDR